MNRWYNKDIAGIWDKHAKKRLALASSGVDKSLVEMTVPYIESNTTYG